MTTFSYTLVLNDSEMITLEAALKLMADHCDREIKTDPRPPFLAWRHNVEQIQSRLFSRARQTSGGGIDTETGKYSISIDLPGRPPEEPKG
jgi:hypothetical protein